MFSSSMPKQSFCFSSSTKLSRRNRIITATLALFVISVLLWSKQSINNHFRTRPIDIYGLQVYPAHLPRARQTSPTELLSRPWTASTNTTALPRIIHQSWETTLIPKKWATWSDSWRVKHPEWEWVLWTNEDNRVLVKERAPWFLDTYDALPGEIYRADVVRNLYMFFFGGLYADLDVECLRSHDSLFDRFNTTAASDERTSTPQPVAIFGRMGRDPNFRDSIPNAWMASSPAHPFFWLPLSYVMDHPRRHRGQVEALTGPIALHQQVGIYKKNTPAALSRNLQQSPLGTSNTSDLAVEHQVVVLNETLIYPYSWNRDGRAFKYACQFNEFYFDPQLCKELLLTTEHESYAITYWSHSWTGTGHNKNNLQNTG